MTTTVLDPKFAKIIALMNSTQHEGEKRSARERAEAVAASCGMTFDEAMASLDDSPSSDPKRGFDDAKERAWQDQRAAEHRERRRRLRARREATIARYGSVEAVIAPCWREKLIVAALGPWRQARDHDPRWTDNLDGWRGSWFDRHKAPAHVLWAIREAYPLPSTFSEAKAEFDHWEARNQEIEDVFTVEGTPIGDVVLDLPVAIRAEIVRELTEHKMTVSTLGDLHARFEMYRQNENHNEEIEAALFRDLEEMVRAKVELTAPPPKGTDSSSAPADLASFAKGRHNVSTPENLSDQVATFEDTQIVRTLSDHLSASDRGVADMLRADVSRSDRHIARACGCSPTTVGKVRRSLGLSAAVRSVQRRGQMYRMKVVDPPKAPA